MITVKYIKKGVAACISHVDVLRSIHRAINRAGIKVNYSEGYGKHILLYLTQPLPIFIESECEYFTVSCDNIGAEEFLARYNAHSPSYMRGLAAYKSVKNPNLAAKITASLYRIPYESDGTFTLPELPKEIIVEQTKNNKTTTKDIRPLIHSMETDSEYIYALVSTGGQNLRVDVLAKYLRTLGIVVNDNEACKTAQYVQGENNLVNADDYLSSLTNGDL